jgi:predicted nucleic acid-binding Zn ribbon protein
VSRSRDPNAPIRRFRKGGTRAVTSLLERVIERRGLSKGFRIARLLSAWDEAVGKQMARTTKAVEMRRDRDSKERIMVVRVQDNTAANFFTMNTPLYLGMLREKLGEAAPDVLQFRVGKLEKDAESNKPRPIKLSASDQAHAQSLVINASDDVIESARKAAQALIRVRLERQRAGFVPCPICANLTEKPEPCLHCRSTLRDSTTLALRKKLIRNPDLALDANLPNDTLQCAKFLALEYLSGQLEHLALQMVQQDDSDLYFYLELTSKAYLALTQSLAMASVTPRDWKHLPAHIRGVLEKANGNNRQP